MPHDPVHARIERLREHPLARALFRTVAPHRAWLVGGAVRDAALGFGAAPELDAVVERDAAETAERLAREIPARLVRLGGERFSALRLISAIGTLDLGDLGDGDLAEDLARRDFTINAVALTAAGGIVDPHAGLDDLARGLLRATRPGVFSEDPLRVLRLARFLVTLPGFREEEETGRLARETAPALVAVAGERIREELARIWGRGGFAPSFAALSRCAAWPLLWSTPDPSLPRGRNPVDAAEVVDRALGSRPGSEAARKEARIACGHVLAARSAAGPGALESIERLARRFALSGAERRSSRLLLELSGESAPETDSDLAWLLHRSLGLGVLALALAAAFDPAPREALWSDALRRAEGLLKRRGAEILSPRALLSGEEISTALGVPPGPELGRFVEALRESQVRGEVTDRAGALERLGVLAADRKR